MPVNTCSQCGSILADGATTCAFCGASVSGEPASAIRQPEPVAEEAAGYQGGTSESSAAKLSVLDSAMLPEEMASWDMPKSKERPKKKQSKGAHSVKKKPKSGDEIMDSAQGKKRYFAIIIAAVIVVLAAAAVLGTMYANSLKNKPEATADSTTEIVENTDDSSGAKNAIANISGGGMMAQGDGVVFVAATDEIKRTDFLDGASSGKWTTVAKMGGEYLNISNGTLSFIGDEGATLYQIDDADTANSATSKQVRTADEGTSFEGLCVVQDTTYLLQSSDEGDTVIRISGSDETSCSLGADCLKMVPCEKGILAVCAAEGHWTLKKVKAQGDAVEVGIASDGEPDAIAPSEDAVVYTATNGTLTIVKSGGNSQSLTVTGQKMIALCGDDALTTDGASIYRLRDLSFADDITGQFALDGKTITGLGMLDSYLCVVCSDGSVMGYAPDESGAASLSING